MLKDAPWYISIERNLDTEYLERLGVKQEMNDTERTCPRCGAQMPIDLCECGKSQEAPVYVCRKCGIEEESSLFGNPYKPMREWFCFNKNKITKTTA